MLQCSFLVIIISLSPCTAAQMFPENHGEIFFKFMILSTREDVAAKSLSCSRMCARTFLYNYVMWSDGFLKSSLKTVCIGAENCCWICCHVQRHLSSNRLPGAQGALNIMPASLCCKMALNVVAAARNQLLTMKTAMLVWNEAKTYYRPRTSTRRLVARLLLWRCYWASWCAGRRPFEGL